MTNKLIIGLSLSLSGRYAMMGRQAETALALFASDCNASGGLELSGRRYEVEINCTDDQSDRLRAALIYRELCDGRRPGLLFSPYGSSLARATAPVAEQGAMLFVNHGGADDDLYRRGYRMIVGVLTPASEYMTEFVRLVSSLKLWRKRVSIISSETPFARAVAAGVESACTERRIRRRGVRVRVKYSGNFDAAGSGERLFRALRRNRANVLISTGSYEHDVRVMRFATSERLYLPVLGCVAAGLGRFYEDLGTHADGIVGTVQWDPGVEQPSTLGPSAAEFVRRFRAATGTIPDYPAAQIYAAGVVTFEAIRTAGSLDPNSIRAAFAKLHATTFFGEFAIDAGTGRQLAHKMPLVQWHNGHKIVIKPVPELQAGALEFPTGWRLLLGSLRSIRLKREVDPDYNRTDEASHDGK
jgi:branched-chain amino acid transport system substrate-binding protein